MMAGLAGLAGLAQTVALDLAEELAAVDAQQAGGAGTVPPALLQGFGEELFFVGLHELAQGYALPFWWRGRPGGR